MDNLHYEKFADGTVKQIEVPFEIPESWEWVSLNNLVQIINGDRGKNYPAKSKLNEFGSIPFVNAGNIIDGYVVNRGLLYLSDEQYNKLGNGKLVRNDIIYCIRGSLGKNGIFTLDKGAIASSLVIIREVLVEEDIKPFLKNYFDSPVASYEILKFNNGTAQPNLAAKDLAKFLVPLPPRDEQIRIVKRIDLTLSKVKMYDNEYSKLAKLNEEFPEKLRKSILQYAMQGKLVPQDPNDEPVEVLLEKIRAEKQRLYKEGKLKKKDLEESIIYKGDDNSYYEKKGNVTNVADVAYKIPKHWRYIKFSDYIQLISGRDLNTSDFQDNLLAKIPYLTGASNFSNGFVSTSRSTNRPSVISYRGDLLITVKGTVGELAFNCFDSAHIARQIMAIRVFIKEENLEFIRLFLKSEINNIQLKAQSMIPGISREVLLSIFIPIAPAPEQVRIIKRVEQFYHLTGQLLQ